MKKILPIGSVIKLKDRKAMIAGYDYCAIKEKLTLCYLLLPYPEGYTEVTDVRIIRAEGVEVEKTGYQSDAFFLVERYFENICTVAESVPATELLAAMDEAEKRNLEEV